MTHTLRDPQGRFAGSVGTLPSSTLDPIADHATVDDLAEGTPMPEPDGPFGLYSREQMQDFWEQVNTATSYLPAKRALDEAHQARMEMSDAVNVQARYHQISAAATRERDSTLEGIRFRQARDHNDRVRQSLDPRALDELRRAAPAQPHSSRGVVTSVADAAPEGDSKARALRTLRVRRNDPVAARQAAEALSEHALAMLQSQTTGVRADAIRDEIERRRRLGSAR